MTINIFDGFDWRRAIGTGSVGVNGRGVKRPSKVITVSSRSVTVAEDVTNQASRTTKD